MRVRFLRNWNRFKRGMVENCTVVLAAYLIGKGFAVEVTE